MTIGDLLHPWRAVRRRDIAERSLDKAHVEITRLRAAVLDLQRPIDKRVSQLETELLQTKRTGYADLAKDLGCSVEDIMDGNIEVEVLLHDDPQAVYRSLDGGRATEVKFRLVKRVNLELRLVIRNLIDTLADCTLTPHAINDFAEAEAYATPRVMKDKRKVLRKRKTLSLNPPEGKDDAEGQAKATPEA